jgi:hypothetical protein
MRGPVRHSTSTRNVPTSSAPKRRKLGRNEETPPLNQHGKASTASDPCPAARTAEQGLCCPPRSCRGTSSKHRPCCKPTVPRCAQSQPGLPAWSDGCPRCGPGTDFARPRVPLHKGGGRRAKGGRRPGRHTDGDSGAAGAGCAEGGGAASKVRLRHKGRGARGGGETRQGIDGGPHGLLAALRSWKVYKFLCCSPGASPRFWLDLWPYTSATLGVSRQG